MGSGTLLFKNHQQACLWENELCGQISDGHWENARPMEHYQVWSHADPKVGSEGVFGRDFPARKDNYNFLDKTLLECVGQRMMLKVRLGMYYGWENVEFLASLFNLEGDALEDGIFSGKYTGEYWDEKRKRASMYDKDLLAQVAKNERAYNKKMLKIDLKDIKATIRHRLYR